MKRMLIAAALLLSSVLGASLLQAEPADPPSSAAKQIVSAPAADDTQPLFAASAASDVQSLSVVTQEASYAFVRESSRRVSVNGQKADAEVFSTLIQQILSMPVATIAPFTPEQNATVTLALTMNDEQYTVFFYRDEDIDNPFVRLIGGRPDSPTYQQTDAWRIGTMLLACEGTRIQDEKGRETPMD